MSCFFCFFQKILNILCHLHMLKSILLVLLFSFWLQIILQISDLLTKLRSVFQKKTASLIWMKQNICFLIQFMLICHRKSETKKCYYFCFSSKKSQMFPKSAYKQWHKNNGNFALVLVSSVKLFEK